MLLVYTLVTISLSCTVSRILALISQNFKRSRDIWTDLVALTTNVVCRLEPFAVDVAASVIRLFAISHHATTTVDIHHKSTTDRLVRLTLPPEVDVDVIARRSTLSYQATHSGRHQHSVHWHTATPTKQSQTADSAPAVATSKRPKSSLVR